MNETVHGRDREHTISVNIPQFTSAAVPLVLPPFVRNQPYRTIPYTVGFHKFNLRIFNLRVSNPNEFIVDVFLTRCRISMCQGLGPKHDETSEVDRTYTAAGASSSRRWRCRWPPPPPARSPPKALPKEAWVPLKMNSLGSM